VGEGIAVILEDMALTSWQALTGNALLFVLVLGLACEVELELFKESLKSRGLLIGCAAQFVILPLLGFLMACTMFADQPEIGIPLIITTSSPGGSYSNWWTSLFNGDLALSVAMTTVSSMLSIGMLPLNLYMYIKGAYQNGNSIRVTWAGLFVSIGVVLCGVGCGLIVSVRFKKAKSIMYKIGNVCGVLLVILGFVFSSNSSAPIWGRGYTFYIGLIIPCVAGLLLALGFARLAKLGWPQSLAVSIEVCYQNTAIALAVILSSFEDDSCTGSSCDVAARAAGVPAFYQLIQVFSLAILCVSAHYLGWTYAPKDVSLFHAITRNFQPTKKTNDSDSEENRSTDIENASSSETAAVVGDKAPAALRK